MLLIRNPISSTKKFFRKTIHTFKSFFSGETYQKLPKTSHTMEGEKTTTRSNITNKNKKMVVVGRNVRDGDGDEVAHNFKKGKKREKQGGYGGFGEGMRREERRCFVAQMLREMEMVDVGNLDHMLDIEEVLHYYSRINCQAYVDIVDRFFLEIYAEFFGPPPSLKIIRA